MNEIHNFKIPISGTDYEPERMELTMSQAHTIARGRTAGDRLSRANK